MFLAADEVRELTAMLFDSQRDRYAQMDRILPAFQRIVNARVVYELNEGTYASGVYFLFRNGALLYVGKAQSIGARVRTHYMAEVDRKPKVIPFNEVSTIEVPAPLNSDVELYYIEKLRPPYNAKYHR